MTATAPASSAILACSAVTTSMITPPLSISAMPRLTRAVPMAVVGAESGVLTANSCSSGVTNETRHGEHTSSFARRPLARTLGLTGLRFRIQFAIAGLKLPARH